MKRLGVLVFLYVLLPACALAHEVRPGYLQLRETDSGRYDVLWKVPARGDERLSLHLVWPEDVTFVTEPSATLEDGASLERSRVERPGGLTGTTIRVEGLESTVTDVLVRVERKDGTTQVTRLTPDHPSFVVEKSPGNLEVARTYLTLGIQHILRGIDHLLFVLSLLILVRGWGRLVKTITAFTLAHSITLSAATLGLVQVPGRPVEAVIALSIMFVASEIVRQERGHAGSTSRWPWVVSFTFGLLHGFGFANALHEVGLPQRAIPVALLFFNVGVEVGQLLFIVGVTMVSLLGFRLIRRLLAREHLNQLAWKSAGAYAIGGVAAFWFIQRTLTLL
ncbi:MAG TPA: HupE/UreJ family protein [Dongiaceae bacterium]|nr:HupE/UreJ family protein [Dongiaceae bacterium]